MPLEKIKLINFCDKAVIFSIYAIAFFLPISKAIIESFSILAIICFLAKKIAEKEDIIKTKVHSAILVYLGICFISIFTSTNPSISSRNFFAKLLQDILFFFAVVETLNTQQRVKNFMHIFFISAGLLGIDGLQQHFTHRDFLRHRRNLGFPRIYASFQTPNDFGCYLSVVIPFALAYLFAKFNSKVLRSLLSGLAILLFVCLILTVSRGAWFAFIVSALFMSIFSGGVGIILLCLAIFTIITLAFYPSFVKERFSNFFIFDDSSSIDRRSIWTAGWKMFKANPWLGLGLGTFMFNFEKFVDEGYKYTAPYAHNCYLQMAAEIGIIGLFAFLSIIAIFFYYGIKALHNNIRHKTFTWFMLLASLASILGYCVQMAVDTNFYSLDLRMLFWLVLGIGVEETRNINVEAKRS